MIVPEGIDDPSRPSGGNTFDRRLRGETYGMVVTEALARGLPVVASDVGGVSEALGHGGLLVPPDDPAALATALRGWLTDAGLRERLRRAARERRETLPSWSATTSVVAGVLSR